MSALTNASNRAGGDPFHHEAFVYNSDQEYCDYLDPFIAEGLDLGDAMLVAVPAARLGILQDAFAGADEEQLRFAPMEELGRNPAWIIPAWVDFFEQAQRDGRGVRGIGEPMWRGRSSDELVECERHEALLNLAFAEATGFTLLCPYDATTLAPSVIAEAHRTHPQVSQINGVSASADFIMDIPALIDAPLSPVPASAALARFDRNSLGTVRRWVAEIADGNGLPGHRVDDLTVAVSEGMTNSVRHGGGAGEISVWRSGDELLCEIRDGGQVADPLAGRLAPEVSRLDGRGLWIMHRVCDLVQLRAVAGGQAVRLHFAV